MELDRQTLTRRWARAERERAGLVRLVCRRGLNPADAEDCVEEAMLCVVHRADLDEARMGALLTTVAVRRAVDLQRRSVSAARATERVTARWAASAYGDDPQITVADRDEARWSASFVAGLPEMQQRVLYARAEGHPVKEIARDLSITSKAVESLISRARAALRTAMSSGLAGVFGLMRRLRGPGAVAAAGGAAAGVIAVVFSLPLLHGPHAGLGESDPGSPREVALQVIDSERPEQDDTGDDHRAVPVLGRPDDPGAEPPGRGDGRDGEPRRMAEVPVPGTGVKVWTEEAEDPNPVNRTIACAQNGYDLYVRAEADNLDDRRYSGRCREEPSPGPTPLNADVGVEP